MARRSFGLRREDFMKSVFPKLKDSPRPVDKTAVKVGFLRGEHFNPRDMDRKFIDGRHRIRTMGTPPKVPERPEGIRDYTGMRHDRMTALWYQFQANSGKSVWLCRCDCGFYEYRKPAIWLRDRERDRPDCCDICRMRDGSIQPKRERSAATHPERLMAWIKRMQELGLTDEEITDIHTLGNGLQTKDRSLDEIRAELADLRQEAGVSA